MCVCASVHVCVRACVCVYVSACVRVRAGVCNMAISTASGEVRARLNYAYSCQPENNTRRRSEFITEMRYASITDRTVLC